MIIHHLLYSLLHQIRYNQSTARNVKYVKYIVSKSKSGHAFTSQSDSSAGRQGSFSKQSFLCETKKKKLAGQWTEVYLSHFAVSFPSKYNYTCVAILEHPGGPLQPTEHALVTPGKQARNTFQRMINLAEPGKYFVTLFWVGGGARRGQERAVGYAVTLIRPLSISVLTYVNSGDSFGISDPDDISRRRIIYKITALLCSDSCLLFYFVVILVNYHG